MRNLGIARSICELSWEAELFTLQDSNSKLVAALHEANANVEQWKKQLSAYQEETERLRDQCLVSSSKHLPGWPWSSWSRQLTSALEFLGVEVTGLGIGRRPLTFRSICELSWEAELFTLQDSNSKLVAALHEANANVEQWKKQLSAYQEETERLRDQVAELEAQGARHAACDIGKDELNQSLEELEAVLKAKDEEIHHLQSKKCDYNEVEQEREEAVQRLQEVESRNAELERRVHALEQTLSNSLDERSRAENEVQRIIDILDVKIFDLTDLRQSLATLVHK
ncbi:UNVERIFIED_CONTAM: hypothetical protein FKN15_045598 [Acipenser sinensis]